MYAALSFSNEGRDKNEMETPNTLLLKAELLNCLQGSLLFIWGDGDVSAELFELYMAHS